MNAWSCDLAPAEDGGQHIQGDVFEVIGLGWAALLAFPDCTYLCSSGLHWNRRRPERAKLTEAALENVKRLAAAPVARKVFENPIGCLSTRWRKPDQIVQPYQFGDDASKATCFWLEGVPKLDPLPRDQWAAPRVVNGRARWANQTDSGQNRLGPSAERGIDRARTYPGIARALAAALGRSFCQPLDLFAEAA